MCWNREDGHAYRAVVSLDADAVAAWEPLPGTSSPTSPWTSGTSAMRCCAADPALAAALARRGITDRSRILTDLWAFGADLVPPRYRGLRLGWADVWYRGSEQGNPYAHHLSGLHPIVDLNRMALLEIDGSSSHGDALPEVMGEYLPTLIPMPLREVAPLEISQPEGVSFQPGREPAPLAELGAAARFQLPGRPGPAHGRVPRRRAAAAGRPPALVRGDGGALPGSDARTTSGAPRSTSASGASGS